MQGEIEPTQDEFEMNIKTNIPAEGGAGVWLDWSRGQIGGLEG